MVEWCRALCGRTRAKPGQWPACVGTGVGTACRAPTNVGRAARGWIVKILAISDQIDERIYSPAVADRFGDVDLVLGCGDLPLYYLEYVVTVLRVPLLYVNGNHTPVVETSYSGEEKREPGGCENVDERVVRVGGLAIGGLEGSLRYTPAGPVPAHRMANAAEGVADGAATMAESPGPRSLSGYPDHTRTAVWNSRRRRPVPHRLQGFFSGSWNTIGHAI